MKKQLMIFDFVCFGIGAIFLTFVAILQNCGINITNGSVIGIVITVLLFTLILLSTANVLGFDCTVSNITFLRPILLFIALYFFYCMPFMGFFGKSGNVWNNIMIASFGIMASRFFFYISKSAVAKKMVKSPFVYTKGYHPRARQHGSGPYPHRSGQGLPARKVRVLRKVFHRIARRTALFRELSFVLYFSIFRLAKNPASSFMISYS